MRQVNWLSAVDNTLVNECNRWLLVWHLYSFIITNTHKELLFCNHHGERGTVWLPPLCTLVPIKCELSESSWHIRLKEMMWPPLYIKKYAKMQLYWTKTKPTLCSEETLKCKNVFHGTRGIAKDINLSQAGQHSFSFNRESISTCTFGLDVWSYTSFSHSTLRYSCSFRKKWHLLTGCIMWFALRIQTRPTRV